MRPEELREVDPAFTEIQQAVLEVSIRLRKVGDQLADLSSGLPEPAEKFDIRAELRGVLECVRSDLLADAGSIR